MAVKSLERKENSLVELTIEVGKGAFTPALEKSYRANAPKMSVPGFRKGKAPRKIIESMYGEGVFYSDAVEETWREAYDKAIESENIKVVDARPDVEVIEITPDGYTFMAKVHLYPDLDIGEYKNISAYYPPVVAEDVEIDAEIEKIRKRNASFAPVDRPAKHGDTLVFDFEGFVYGEAFKGGKAEGYQLELGSGQFIPGFEARLVGVKAGDTPDVDVTFPEDYHAENLAGKPAVFKCKIHEIKEKLIPEADDEFAKDVSEFDTLSEYKDDIRAKILKNKEQQSQHIFEDGLIAKIVNAIKDPIPPPLIARQLENVLNDLQQSLQMRGMNIEQYMKANEMNQQQLFEQLNPRAEHLAKAALVFEKIAKLENLEVSDEEIEVKYKELSERYDFEVEKIKEQIDEEIMIRDMLFLKASDVIKESGIKLDTLEEGEIDAPFEMLEMGEDGEIHDDEEE